MAVELRVWIGRRLRELRSAQGYSQQILADHAGISREHLSALENGRFDPTTSLLERLSLALGTDLNHFFQGR